MRRRLTAALLTLPLVLSTGCGMANPSTSAPEVPVGVTSVVVPSAKGAPIAVATLGNYEFITEQVVGQIYTYSLASGTQVQVGNPYNMPCADPSGMVIGTVNSTTVMAVACYDTGSLVTLRVNSDGSLSPLGVVSGLSSPYPGIVLDGTNVYVPLFGISGGSNGAVARVSIADPSAPAVLGVATLASPVPGGYANPGYITSSNGYLYVAAGSESGPLDQSSTIQVVNEATMTLAGSPLVVAHSPQHIEAAGSTLFVTFYDASQLESINAVNPAALSMDQVYPLTTSGGGCSAIGLTVLSSAAYVGCYDQGVVMTLNVANPRNMYPVSSVSGVGHPEGVGVTGGFLISTDAVIGGGVYQMTLAPLGGRV